MRFETERYTSRRDTLTFAVCVLLSLILRFAPAETSERLASAIRATVLAPLLLLQVTAESQKNSRVNFESVLLSRDSLATRLTLLDEVQAENRRLRALLDLRLRIRGGHVTAEVLHQSQPTEGLTLALDVGSNDGVDILMPVITPEGLAGVVRSVAPNSSVVALWTHPEFRVNVVSHDGSVVGTARARGFAGPNTTLMELTGVSYRDVMPVGTRLYTSGLGGVFPRGIPVGEILEDVSQPSGWERTYVVMPSVHPAGVSHVIVLLRGQVDFPDFSEGTR
ncbi:MAG: rod shape-determining protein MreC [Gemmatimonadales bacterium]